MKFIVYLTVLIVLSVSASASGNQNIKNFSEAKKIAVRIHQDHQIAIYCPCKYSNKTIDLKSCGYEIYKDLKRASRLEWEHVVPAEAFGNSFAEWREGSNQCIKKSGHKFKGRKCAKTNPEFNRIESDLYNLWPVIGELNGLRSNFSMAQISGETQSFGNCKAKIQNRKFEPMDLDKGVVARTYMYMDLSYPNRGIISDKNKKLFESWDKLYPVSKWECERAKLIKEIQGNENQILSSKCNN
jgi:deoxyribonuclease-1